MVNVIEKKTKNDRASQFKGRNDHLSINDNKFTIYVKYVDWLMCLLTNAYYITALKSAITH